MQILILVLCNVAPLDVGHTEIDNAIMSQTNEHFVTMAKKYGVDEYAIKYMVGHKISDITEKVYTQREFEWLKDEIEKIK